MQQLLWWAVLALLCWVALGGARTTGGPGYYTFFYPKNWPRRYSHGPTSPGSTPSKFSKEYEGQTETLLGMCSTDRIEGSAFLKQLFQSDRKDKYRRLAVSGSTILLSRTSWPLGWRHTLFQSALLGPASTDDIGAVELTSIGTGRFSKKRIRIILRFSTSDKDTLQVTTSASYSHMSHSEVERTIDDLMFFARPAARDAYAICRARFNQKQQQNDISRRTKEERKKSELDRILHPELYKRKRNHGMHTDSGSGSGRYTPSEATQARRVVRRGG